MPYHKQNSSVEKETENIFIIQPVFDGQYAALHREAVSLIESAGGAYAGTVYQHIREINPATFVGAGKLAEVNAMLEGLENITVLFNGELSPSQTLNISAALSDRKVIDRTTLILDIFARNALSGEGKLQVELAQLRYIYPRLKGEGAKLSRLGGGIGTRGPGETQLETDRRLIRGRIRFLSGKVEEMKRRRAGQTARRQKNSARTIALVGYTNTGKSTLMNLLTDAGVYVQDQLFATLATTSRLFRIEGVDFILTDTVGFLRELPHHLVDAFRSTLESAVNCDLALIVCDASDDYEMQLKTTLDTLKDLDFHSPYLVVMNKCDKAVDRELFPKDCVCVSAKTGEGIDELKRRIFGCFSDKLRPVELFVPYARADEYGKIRRRIAEKQVEYTDDGLKISAVIPEECYAACKPFLSADPLPLSDKSKKK